MLTIAITVFYLQLNAETECPVSNKGHICLQMKNAGKEIEAQGFIQGNMVLTHVF